jgi:DNA-binding response OmpR family regulator
MSERIRQAVILLAQPCVAEQLARELRSRGMAAAVAQGSEALHRLLQEQAADVLVIEQQLDGFLSGLEILKRLQSGLFHPATVLVGELSPVDRALAERLGVCAFVADPEDVSNMSVVAAALAMQAAPELSPIPQRARLLAAEANVVRPLPQVLTKLCVSLHDDKLTLAELAKDISVDPRITAELLRVVNSTSAGLSRKVASVREAVGYLGVRRTLATVISSGVLSSQATLLQGLPDAFRAWYQHRSLLIASTAAAFAEQIEHASAETAQILGLFQDLGVLLLVHALPRAYQRVFQRQKTVGQLRLEHIERAEFGITHADVSAALLEHWEVPAPLVELVLDHHLPERRGEHNELEQRYLRAMRVAEALANLSDLKCPARYRQVEACLEFYGAGQREACKACIACGVARTAEFSRFLAQPAPDSVVLKQLLLDLQGEFKMNGTAPTATMAPSVADASPAEGSLSPGITAPMACPAQARVLVIDDNPDIINVVKLLLRSTGFEVEGCRYASQAVAAARNADIILCDVHLMDGMGTSVVQQLRAAGIEAPVVMISGDRSRHTVTECIASGVVDYLVKPFTRSTLLERLNKHLASANGRVGAAVAAPV